jgi:Leucine-rich repeat (LRR) protein
MTNLVYLYMRRNDLKFNLNFLKSGKLKDLCKYCLCEITSKLFRNVALTPELQSVALWLDDNKITGTIPTQLGLLTELASISLTNATLRGKIPTELGMLSGLRRLWLYSNELTGSVPAELNQLSALEVLQVHNNSLTGAMPQGICSIIDKSPYEFKSLTSDCLEKVTCDGSCCTECY